MPVAKIHVSLPNDLLAQIDERGQARSTTISRDLERLYALYRRALRQIDLTVDEACLIVDALNGSLTTADDASLLWARVEDAIHYEKLDEKWNVDGRALVDKLRGLNEIQALAVADAAERFWEIESADNRDIREDVKRCFGIGG